MKREEMLELLEIPEIEEIIAAKLAELRLLYREEIQKLRCFGRENLVHFSGPAKGPLRFRLERRQGIWLSSLEPTPGQEAGAESLPPEVVQWIAAHGYPGGAFTYPHVAIHNVLYSLEYYYYTDTLICGSIQVQGDRIAVPAGSPNIICINTIRYVRFPESEQLKVFHRYFDHYPTLRRTVLHYFFLRILPYSDIIEA